MIGMLELSGADGAAVATTQPPPDAERAAARLKAPAGEPDREVEALRRTVDNLARGDREAQVEADLDRRRQEATVESLLREMDTQREVLRERNRLLARERARLRRIRNRVPYRVYLKLRHLPVVRSARRPARASQTGAAAGADRPARADTAGAHRALRRASPRPVSRSGRDGDRLRLRDPLGGQVRALRAARHRAGARAAGAADRGARANVPLSRLQRDPGPGRAPIRGSRRSR